MDFDQQLEKAVLDLAKDESKGYVPPLEDVNCLSYIEITPNGVLVAWWRPDWQFDSHNADHLRQGYALVRLFHDEPIRYGVIHVPPHALIYLTTLKDSPNSIQRHLKRRLNL